MQVNYSLEEKRGARPDARTERVKSRGISYSLTALSRCDTHFSIADN